MKTRKTSIDYLGGRVTRPQAAALILPVA